MNKNIASTVNQAMSYTADTVKQNVSGIYAIDVKEHLPGVIGNQNTRDASLHFENGSLKDIPSEHCNVCIEPAHRHSVEAFCIGLSIHHNSKYFQRQQHRLFLMAVCSRDVAEYMLL